METAEIVRHLRDLFSQASPAGPLEVRETHASIVFLAAADAYKLKKPVNLGFLDFSTLEKRHAACEAEVALNRRLAPGVYLGMRPVCQLGHILALDGPGEPVDYLVHMRRLPDSASLEARIIARRATSSQVETLADRLASFHLAAERSPRIDAFGLPAAIRANVEENFAQLAGLAGPPLTGQLAEIARLARHFLDANDGLFLLRVAGGCIRDGHGDLRAEHVYFEPGHELAVIDCIEFNERFRYGDVASDIAFLAMDLDRLGRPDLAATFVRRYADATPFAIHEVLDFYGCYRAVVRAKVALIRASQAEDPAREAALVEADRYVELALGYAQRMESAAANP